MSSQALPVASFSGHGSGYHLGQQCKGLPDRACHRVSTGKKKSLSDACLQILQYFLVVSNLMLQREHLMEDQAWIGKAGFHGMTHPEKPGGVAWTPPPPPPGPPKNW